MYADFEPVIPETLDEALAALAEGNGAAQALAGGTNMIVDLRARRARPERVVMALRQAETTKGPA